MSALSAEFQLCVECCRWAFAGDGAPRIHELCGSVDWARFAHVVRFHRVQGLVWNCLWSVEADVPTEIAHALSAEAEGIVAANLQMALEARELRTDFERAGLPLLFVKGLAVAALAYPKPLLKMGWDIDLLIDGEQLSGAVQILRARGYRPAIPRPPANLQSWHRRRKESVWTGERGLYVELHTRLADNARLIPGIGVHSPRQEVKIAPGTILPTLDCETLFAYLCVHGASSAWFRLKWITDLAALLHGMPGDEIERLYGHSQKLGACRSAGQALLLADRLYGTLARSRLKDQLLRDRATRWLANAALQQLASKAVPRDPASTPLGTWRIHLTQLLLSPSLGFKLGELYRQAADAIL